MRTKNYPHPVLSEDSNDFNKKIIFDVNLLKSIKNTDYEFSYDFSLNDYNLSSLLVSDEVKFIIKTECSATRFRKVLEFNQNKGTFYLPSQNVEGEVILSTFVVAKTRIENYYSENFSEDYGNVTFKVYSGDILAEGPQFSFNVDKLTDSLAKVPSIFTIIQKSDNTNPDFSFEEAQILIRLNKTDFDQYKDLKTAHKDYYHLAALSSSLFILPALSIFIDRIKNEIGIHVSDREEYEIYINDKETEFKWFKVIIRNLKKHNIDLFDTTETSFSIAQTLLGNPLSNGINFFKETPLGAQTIEEELI